MNLLWQWMASLLLMSFLLGTDAAARTRPDDGMATIAVQSLPPEARETLARIRQGGPFPYAKDGVVFGNYEGLLPRRRRGYYHEFTVRTPRSRDRGARRIVIGGDPATSEETYYSDDHYATFKRIQQ